MTTPAPLTEDEFRAALPDKVKKSISSGLIQQINTVLSNPDEYEFYRNNLISYTSVMQDGKFKVEQYIDAVRYVSFKLQGLTNIDAFSRTFPDKMAYYNANGTSAKDIASYVSAYNKGKLVNLIFEQTLIPTHVLNMDLHQKAINHLANLMITAKSEMVQKDAAIGLINATKAPETKKVQLDIAHKEDGGMSALHESALKLAEMQRQIIASGAMNAQQVAHQNLVFDMDGREVNP